MATVIMDHLFAQRLRDERKAAGSDRWDEVWEGTYMMAPLPNNEHQQIVTRLAAIFQETVGWDSADIVLPGANVSDREKGWQHNYRCPTLLFIWPVRRQRIATLTGAVARIWRLRLSAMTI